MQFKPLVHASIFLLFPSFSFATSFQNALDDLEVVQRHLVSTQEAVRGWDGGITNSIRATLAGYRLDRALQNTIDSFDHLDKIVPADVEILQEASGHLLAAARSTALSSLDAQPLVTQLGWGFALPASVHLVQIRANMLADAIIRRLPMANQTIGQDFRNAIEETFQEVMARLD